MTEPLIIPEAAKLEVEYLWTDPAGDPIDVTGYLATFTIREPKESTELISLDETDGVIVGNSDGTFTVTIPASFSAGKAGLTAVSVLDVKANSGADAERLAKRDIVVESKY